ncbi:MAG: NAD-dependent dehydratase, partial [Proteobacteria bacterium]|nr:NAD-dependent dehydratase [Pseudomonadota bacterium]
VLRAVREPQACSGRFDLVEAEGRPLGAIIALHRSWLGFSPARIRLVLPAMALRPVSFFADLLGWLGWRSPLRSNSMAALIHGVKGDAAQAACLLGREPLTLPAALAALGPAGKADRWHARLALLFPVALAALVLLWLASGALGLVRPEAAARLLVDGGMEPRSALFAVIVGSLTDLAIAAGLLFRASLASALRVSILVALAYLVGSLAIRPDLWLDPLGPMVKVIPAIMLSLACLAMSGER